jgi:hypothetical protein
MTAADTLRAARALIEKPEHWTQGWFARTEDGRQTKAGALDAFSFCIVGAIDHVNGPHNERAREFLRSVVPHFDITSFNDRKGRSHRTILKKFDEAIALAERQQA